MAVNIGLECVEVVGNLSSGFVGLYLKGIFLLHVGIPMALFIALYGIISDFKM